jgi:thioredoxin 1
MKNVIEVTDGTFDTEVLNSDLPVLVDFWAPWCGPCRMMSPILEAAAEKLAGRVRIVKLNTDENQATARKFNIMAIPTMIVFAKGGEKDRLMGFMPQAALEAKLAVFSAPAPVPAY